MRLEQYRFVQSDICSSLELLRQIRGSIRDSLASGIDDDFSQIALNHAQILGEATANTLLSKPSECLRSILAKISPGYLSSAPFTSYQRPEVRVADKILRIPHDIQKDWRLSCNSLLHTMNELSDVIPEELLNRSLGVYSPLSSDYLTIAVYRESLRRYVSPEVFQLRPAYTSGSNISDGLALLSADTEGQPFFHDCSKVGALLDTVGLSTNTKPKLGRAISLFHPNQKTF